jgi:superfamily II DNA or RNA helicase
MHWTRVIVDEVHKIKNPTTIRSKAVYGFNAERRMGLTATQIHKSAADLFGVLRWLYPQAYRNKRKYYLKYVETEKDFMGHEHIVGTRNVTGLAREIAPFTMVVKADDEFAGVPKALFIPTNVPMTAVQDELYWKVANADDVFVEGTNLTVLNGLSRLSKLQQIGTDPRLVDEDMESSKIEWLLDWVEELQEQAIIFTRWRSLAGRLASMLNCPLVASGSPEGSELPFKRGDAKLLVATIDAAAESLDFPNVHTDVFLDCHPSGITMAQAIGRIDRPGSGVTAVKRHYFLQSSIVDREMYDAFVHNKGEADMLYSAIASHQRLMKSADASQNVRVN